MDLNETIAGLVEEMTPPPVELSEEQIEEQFINSMAHRQSGKTPLRMGQFLAMQLVTLLDAAYANNINLGEEYRLLQEAMRGDTDGNQASVIQQD